MTSTLQNSIWPNDDGNLGKIKVQIPDGVNVKWPEGDALLGNCVYQNGKLIGFVDTKALTVNSSGSTTINYDYVNIELPFAEDAMTINRGPRNKYLFIKFNDKEMEEGIVYVRFEELSDETKALLRSATTIRDNVLYDNKNNIIGEFNTDTLLTCHNFIIGEDKRPVINESDGRPKTIDGKIADTLFIKIDFNTLQQRTIKLTSFSSGLSSLTDGCSMFDSCYNLKSFDADLSSLTNGSDMFSGCSGLTTFNADLSSLKDSQYMFYNCENLTSFTSDLPSLANAWCMFNYCSNLTTFTSDLPSLTIGYSMFDGCSKLTSFVSNLPNLTDGRNMFFDCSSLTSFSSDLSSLMDGGSMFAACYNLTTFDADLSSLTYGNMMFESCPLISFASDLPSLTNGYYMFSYCENLPSFSSDLSSLADGTRMFYYCTALTSFNSDLHSLTDGGRMFYNCSNLTSFNSDLSSLTSGYDMFTGCKLDTTSIQNIADTINTISNGLSIHIGIGNSEPNEQEAAAFNTIATKGWVVYVGVNGGSSSEWNPTSLTPIDGEEQQTPIPFYAKPVQSDEKHARYIDENGNFYNILGGNYIYGDDLSTYGMFTCEADAAANMRLTKIEKSQPLKLKKS